MRTFLRSFALAVVLIWAVGPAFAAPLLLDSALTIGAPRAPAAVSPGLEVLLYLTPIAFGITIKRSAADIAAKFATRAGAAVNDYKTGVEGAGPEWESQTKASEPAWEAGMQEAIADKRFMKGVSKAGAAKYQRNASTLGPARFQQGVSNAKDAYTAAMGPVLDVLRNLSLPPKGARRSPQNMQRANAVALALGNWKTGK